MKEQQAHALRMSDFFIIVGGIVTTALTLFAVYMLIQANPKLDIMSYYLLFIFPAGATLVGIGAGSGYGLVSWFSGRKVTVRLIGVILLFLVTSYGLAQWIQFKNLHLQYTDTGQAVGFFEYYDAMTRSISFKLNRSSVSTGQLGTWGYLFRVLELAGFCFGGLIIPSMLKNYPYCERCHMYMRRLQTWWIPASVPTRKIKKNDTQALAAYASEMETAYQNGSNSANQIIKAVEEKNIPLFHEHTAKTIPAKDAAKMEARYEIKYCTCKTCGDGVIRTTLWKGTGENFKREKIAEQSVDSGFTSSLGPV